MSIYDVNDNVDVKFYKQLAHTWILLNISIWYENHDKAWGRCISAISALKPNDSRADKQRPRANMGNDMNMTCNKWIIVHILS